MPAATTPKPGRWSESLLEDAPQAQAAPQVQQPPQTYQHPSYGESSLSADPNPRKREMKGFDYKPASFATLVKSEVVDDPETKMKIFAEARGLPVHRYFMEDGKIKFIGEDGYAHDEVIDTTTLQRARKWAAAAAANAPAEVGAGVGAFIAGPIGAAGGAAAGEGVRKVIARTVFDEPQTAGGNALDIAVTGAVGGLAEGAGRLAVGRLNKALQRGPVGKLVSGDYPRINPAHVDALERKAKEQGVDLLAPESADLPWAQTTYKVLRQKPGKAGDIIKDFERNTRIPQVEAAISRNLNAISPEDSIGLAADRGVQATREIKEGLKTARSNAAAPVYDRAFQGGASVDVAPVLDEIDGLMSKAPNGSRAQKALQRVRKMLVNEGQDEAGNVVEMPVSELETLDLVKKEIDVLLDGPDGASIHADTKRRLAIVKDNLRQQMVDASGDYGEALKTFAEKSGPIDAFDRTLLRRVANLPEDQLERAPGILFGPNASPRAIGQARAQFALANKLDAWNGMVRAHLQDVLQNVPQSVPAAGKGASFRNLVAKGGGLERLKAAMTPQQFTTFSDFMDVLEATGRMVDRNSDTVAKQMAREAIEDESMGALRRLGRKSPQQMVLDGAASFLDAVRRNGSAEKLAAALVDPANVKTVRTLKQLPIGSQKWIRAATVLLGEGIRAQYQGASGNLDPYGARAGAQQQPQPGRTEEPVQPRR